MTLEPITKDEMLYIKKRNKDTVVTVTSRQHPRKKTRYLEMSEDSIKYLNEIREIESSNVLEKHGWFTEEYKDKETGQIKHYEVFYK